MIWQRNYWISRQPNRRRRNCNISSENGVTTLPVPDICPQCLVIYKICSRHNIYHISFTAEDMTPKIADQGSIITLCYKLHSMLHTNYSTLQVLFSADDRSLYKFSAHTKLSRVVKTVPMGRTVNVIFITQPKITTKIISWHYWEVYSHE